MWPGDAAWQALLGGEDYELLFAVPPRRRRTFHAAIARHHHVPAKPIGRLTARREGIRVRRPDDAIVPLPRGYEHFAVEAGLDLGQTGARIGAVASPWTR
jgi:thiamine-monophosphate kinase